MRIAALVYLAPRKLGSLEQWILGFVEECARRGHTVHLFWAEPIHPAIRQRIEALGIPWTAYRELERSPLAWGSRLRRNFDIVYMNLVVPRSRGALAAYLAWPLPVLLFDGISGPVPGRSRPSLLGPVLDPLLAGRLTGMAGCSEYVVARNINRFRIDPARCRVIYNGIDTRRFAVCPKPESHPPLLAVVARLIPEKGVDVLLEACRHLLDLEWRLRIVGQGVEELRLRELASTLDLDRRVEFLGLRDDVESTLREAVINIHPCVWEEAFGLTIAEAMAAGCATIASDIGGIPELIRHGKSGLLVPPGKPIALAAAIRHLLEDPELCHRLGVAASEEVVARFDLGPAITQQVDWIEQTVAARDPAKGIRETGDDPDPAPDAR